MPGWLAHLHRGCLLLWFAYLLVAPTVGFRLIDSWHDEQRAVQLGLLALTSAVFALRCVAVGLPPMSWLLLGVLALGLVSSANAAHRLAAFAEVGLVVQLAVLAMVTRDALSGSGPATWLLLRRLVLLIAAAHALGVVVRCVAALQLGGVMEPAIFMLGFANPRFASAFYVVLMPILAWHVVAKERNAHERGAAFAVLSLLWFANIGLGTRGVWLAIPGGLIAAALISHRSTVLRLAAAMALSAAAGAVVYALFTWGLASRAPLEAAQAVAPSGLVNTTLTGRDALWRAALEAVATHPWLGLGPMGFASLGLLEGTHPHNWPLQLAAEWGVPALSLIVFWMTGVALRQRGAALAAGARHPDVHPPELSAALAAVLILGFVDGNLLMPVSQSTAAIAAGALFACGARANANSNRSTGRDLRSFFAAFLLAVLAASTLRFAGTTFLLQSEARTAFRQKHPDAWVTPRVWEHGAVMENRSGQ